MLRIVILGDEFYNEETNQILTQGDVVLDFEHSLAALSKWESIWEKPFLTLEEPTTEETLSYLECMIVTPEFPPEAISKLSQGHIDQIQAYINKKHSATWFRETQGGGSREVITAELIYFWMTVFHIDLNCQYWHLNQLFTLIKVANEKNTPAKKVPRRNAAAQQRALNEQRLAAMGSSG